MTEIEKDVEYVELILACNEIVNKFQTHSQNIFYEIF